MWRRLIEHGGDHFFEAFCTESEAPCEAQILVLDPFVFVFVVRSARSRREGANVFAVASFFVFLLVAFWSLPMDVV